VLDDRRARDGEVVLASPRAVRGPRNGHDDRTGGDLERLLARAAQRPSPSGQGLWGWRYASRPEIELFHRGAASPNGAQKRELEDSDTSITGWCILALESGQRAGLSVRQENIAGALAFAKFATAEESGLVGYLDRRGAGAKVTGPNDHYTYHPATMSALGMSIRMYAEQNHADPVLDESAQVIAKDVPAISADKLSIDYYYWYHASLALNQFDGPDSPAQTDKYWGPWSKALAESVLALLDGSPSTVTTSSTTSSSYNHFPSMLTGDERAFMVDVQNLPSIGGPWSWTFSGLSDGAYQLYTYAWAPENNGVTTTVTVPGSTDGPQAVGGLWSGGAHVLGTTYARHAVSVVGGTLFVEVVGQSGSSGSVNGFQLVRQSVGPSAFCFGDGSGTTCPCGNFGASGRGCASSVNAAGGRLLVSGNASVGTDTMSLNADGMPNSSALYFQGTSQQNGGAGITFGDGLRCAGGSIIRLGTKLNVGGASSYPVGGDQTVSVRGNVSAGDVRTYQVWYRNAAAFCTASTFNLTNGMQVPWGA